MIKIKKSLKTTKIIKKIICISFILLISCGNENSKSSKGLNLEDEHLTISDLNENELSGKKFRLSNMFEGTEITISIENGSFVGNSGVNLYNIPFELKNNEITIGEHGMSTLMAGPEQDMKAEDEYLKLLNSAKYISFDDYNLCIKTADNQILLFDLAE